MTIKRFLLLFIVFFHIFLLGCTKGEKFEKQELVIEGKAGNVIIKTEIAKTDPQRQQGYMFRKQVNDGEAMLFVFEREQILSFWMKNTLVPLSIAFITHDGKILEIFDMYSGDLTPVNSSRSVRYALEVPQGWFARAGVGPGDKLDLSKLN